jgi:hypoxanthine phosphoribosyltransferase
MKTTLINERAIQKRIQELAIDIRKTYRGKPFVVMGVLNGAYMFASDLSKALWETNVKNFTVDFIGLSSYQNKTTTSYNPLITKEPTDSISGKDILLVEDIIDSGTSIQFLKNYFTQKQSGPIRICALLSKPSRREIDVRIDFLGFEIQDKWVEGYGMDTAGIGRGNPDIVERLEE